MTMSGRHVSMLLALSILTIKTWKSKSILMAQAFSTETKAPLRILCFGDSLTAGTTGMFQERPYAPHLQRALEKSTKLQNLNVEVMHMGFPGWQSTDLLRDADGRSGLRTTIRGNSPISLVILLAGTNDLGYGKSSDQITQGVVSLHKLCLEEQVPNTIAIGIPSSFYQENDTQAKEVATTANQGIQSFCTSDPRAVYVPFPFGYSRGDDKWDSDGLHFSPKGYLVLGESLAPAVEEVVAKQLGL